MAEEKKSEVKANTQDPDTKIEQAIPLADPSKGEISPAADQSNRGAEIAARMQVTPAQTLGQQKEEERKKAESEKKESIVQNDKGEYEFVDPDDLEKQAVVEVFPKNVCINCRNHDRGDVELDDRGFCKKCGFKLNRLHNMALEPSRKAV